MLYCLQKVDVADLGYEAASLINEKLSRKAGETYGYLVHPRLLMPAYLASPPRPHSPACVRYMLNSRLVLLPFYNTYSTEIVVGDWSEDFTLADVIGFAVEPAAEALLESIEADGACDFLVFGNPLHYFPKDDNHIISECGNVVLAIEVDRGADEITLHVQAIVARIQ